MAKISITDGAQACSCTRKLEVSPFKEMYGTDVIRSVLLHICANLGMMLARDYASCIVARSTLVMCVGNKLRKLKWPAKSMDLNHIDHLLDL